MYIYIYPFVVSIYMFLFLWYVAFYMDKNESFILEIYFYQCIDGQCIFLDPFILK